MKCPKCQFENREGVKFCEECGSKLDLVCPNCKTKIPPGRKFCGECGHELIESSKAPVIDFSEPQSYTPKYLADKILTTRSSIEGERKLVTVLFADVAKYTSISEKLDPEEIHQIMDGCFKILMDEIHKYEGTINQFTGDGVMAIFGAPVAHEDHPQRACYSAIAVQEATIDYGEKIKKDYGIEFKIRIGINSGPVVVGSIGDDLRMDYTAIGDTTNLASRIENKARPGSILVSKNTHKVTKDFFEFKPIGNVEIKGKEKPQEIFELIKTGQVETRFKASVAKGLTKFVGRNSSMAALKEPYGQVIAGSGQVIGIVGEAGVGKSRLLLEFVRKLPPDHVTSLEGRCLHYGSSIIYMPFLEILKSYFEVREEDREFFIKKKINEKILALDEKLISIIPPLQDLLSLKVDDESYVKLEPTKKREKIFEAIRDLFIRASQEKPLILAIEDLHWIDKTSEEFLSYLIEWLANACILIILLYRPEYTHHWGSKSYYHKIGLTQLGTVSSSKLVKAILDDGGIVKELEQLILNRATGNPLYIEELTYSLLENGTIQKKGRKYVLDTKVSDIHVPDTIQGIIAARMDRLEEELKRTMQVASVIGREFAFRILQIISGMREEIKSYLLNLQGLEFIYEKSLFPELEYIFKHAFTQEVAYNSLLLARKKEIHEKIGDAIHELYPHRLEEFYEMLAYHYSRSDNLEKTYKYLILSGKKATRNFSNWEAFRYYKEAIKIFKKLFETEENEKEKIKVINSMITSMSQLGFPEDSLKYLQEKENLSRKLDDKRNLAAVYAELSMYYSFKGDHSQGIKYSEKGFQTAKKIEDVRLMVTLAPSICSSYHMVGENQKLVEVAASVIDVLVKTKKIPEYFTGGFNTYSSLCALSAVSHAFLGNFEEAEAMGERGLNSAIKINHLPSQGYSEIWCGDLFAIKGDGNSAIRYFKDSIRHLEEGQVVPLLGLSWCGLGWGHHLLGNNIAALQHVEKGLDMQISAGIPMYLSFIYLILGMIHFDLGNLKNAQTCAQKALELSQQNNEKQFEAPSLNWLGRILAKANPSQIDKAKEYILTGIKVCEDLGAKPIYSMGYLFLGELYAEADQQEKALECLKKADGMFQEMGMGYWLAKTQKVMEKH